MLFVLVIVRVLVCLFWVLCRVMWNLVIFGVVVCVYVVSWVVVLVLWFWVLGERFLMYFLVLKCCLCFGRRKFMIYDYKVGMLILMFVIVLVVF